MKVKDSVDFELAFGVATFNLVLEYTGDYWRVNVSTNKFEFSKQFVMYPSEFLSKERNDLKVTLKNKLPIDDFNIVYNGIVSRFVDMESKIVSKINESRSDNGVSEELIRVYVNNGRMVYDFFKKNGIDPIGYICDFTTWLVAAEANNVIKVLSAIVNTAKGNATNIFSESAAATGKSHIENTAFDLVHDHHYINLNYSTPAAFRALCQDNPYFFDCKVIRFGDMGTPEAMEVVQEVMNIVKILNSEGEYRAKKMANDNKSIQDIVLKGTSAMSFTKVANESIISDQDKSRGIIFTPNLDTDDLFNAFKSWYNVVGDTDYYNDYVNDIKSKIRDYIEFLINFDVKVINPYESFFNYIYQHNKVYRRIIDKELNMVNTLALFNLPNKVVYNVNDTNYVYVSIDDVSCYLSLFEKDVVSNTHFMVSTNELNFFEMLCEHYEVVDGDYMDVFRSELNCTFLDNSIDIHDFEDSKYFFTVHNILKLFRDRKELTNVISEVNDERKKLHSILRNGLTSYIDFFTLPNEYYEGRGKNPIVYYIKNKDYNLNKLRIDLRHLKVINDMIGENIVIDIYNDFKLLEPVRYGNVLVASKGVQYDGIGKFDYIMKPDYLKEFDYNFDFIKDIEVVADDMFKC